MPIDYRNLEYPFKENDDAPYNVVRVLNECWDDYSNGNLGNGEYMASGKEVSEEFFKRLKQLSYDELKYTEIAKTLEEDVDENNQHLYHKHYEPSETKEDE